MFPRNFDGQRTPEKVSTQTLKHRVVSLAAYGTLRVITAVGSRNPTFGRSSVPEIEREISIISEA